MDILARLFHKSEKSAIKSGLQNKDRFERETPAPDVIKPPLKLA
jgi:hypothetical protein